jgi:hypothetical protein
MSPEAGALFKAGEIVLKALTELAVRAIALHEARALMGELSDTDSAAHYDAMAGYTLAGAARFERYLTTGSIEPAP